MLRGASGAPGRRSTLWRGWNGRARSPLRCAGLATAFTMIFGSPSSIPYPPAIRRESRSAQKRRDGTAAQLGRRSGSPFGRFGTRRARRVAFAGRGLHLACPGLRDNPREMGAQVRLGESADHSRHGRRHLSFRARNLKGALWFVTTLDNSAGAGSAFSVMIEWCAQRVEEFDGVAICAVIRAA